MAFTIITVSGTFQDTATTAPLAGTLTFTLADAISNGTVTLTPSPIVATLDNTGSFTINLAATDDIGTTPTGVWYSVTEQISGGSPRDYFIQILSGYPSSVSLASLTPGTPGWL